MWKSIGATGTSTLHNASGGGRAGRGHSPTVGLDADVQNRARCRAPRIRPRPPRRGARMRTGRQPGSSRRPRRNRHRRRCLRRPGAAGPQPMGTPATAATFRRGRRDELLLRPHSRGRPRHLNLRRAVFLPARPLLRAIHRRLRPDGLAAFSVRMPQSEGHGRGLIRSPLPDGAVLPLVSHRYDEPQWRALLSRTGFRIHDLLVVRRRRRGSAGPQTPSSCWQGGTGAG